MKINVYLIVKRIILTWVIPAFLVAGCSNSQNFENEPLSGLETISGSSENSMNKIDGTNDPDPYTEYSITPGATKSFTYNISNKQSKYLLTFNARIHTSSLAGMNNVLRIRVNGTLLTRTKLVNKSTVHNYPDNGHRYEYVLQDTRRGNWFNDANSAWVLSRAPNYYENNVTFGAYGILGGETTDYEMDITALLQNGANTIEFIHVNNTSNTIKIAAVDVWHEIANQVDTTIWNNQNVGLNFSIVDASKKHIIRFYSKIDYPSVSNASNCMKVRLDSAWLGRYDINNKPSIANAYPFASFKYKYMFNNGSTYYYTQQYTEWEIFDVVKSPNFYGHNVTFGSYGILGGEAYKFDFQVPPNQNTAGAHNINVYNLDQSYSMSITGFKTYEVENL